ncbi:hypothetical protein CVT24_000009 [Panaeolus cyanescens]|uniref:Uncharacterized protein n=1 Tax=Panaeolus cyanescens TaxID=181874 RepID=A0A409VSD5_9AGAR|nr:hypothetical protein CVT24_000009 [Panaeolus cyanescens]
MPSLKRFLQPWKRSSPPAPGTEPTSRAQSRSRATTPTPPVPDSATSSNGFAEQTSTSPRLDHQMPNSQLAEMESQQPAGSSEQTGKRPEPVRLDTLVDLVNSAVAVSAEEVQLDDIIIAVMGPTGTGKTTFIQAAAGTNDVGLDVGHSLSAGTTGVRCVKIPIPGTHSNLVLVDTPGFDDPDKSDAEILEIIAKWLESTYRRQILLTGLVYLHRITDIRHDVGIQNTMNVFQRLAGPNAFERVALVTTMWNDLRDKQIGVEREEQLMNNHWRPMIIRKAMTGRFDSQSRDTAVKVIRDIAEKNNKTVLLQLQDELVNKKKSLPSTSAGKVAFTLEEAMKWRLRQLGTALKAN